MVFILLDAFYGNQMIFRILLFSLIQFESFLGCRRCKCAINQQQCDTFSLRFICVLAVGTQHAKHSMQVHPVDVNESMLISECYRIAFEFKVYAGIMNSVILQSLPCFPQLNCVCCFIQAVYFLYSSAEWKNVIEYGNDQIMKHYNRFSTIFL